MDRWDVKLSRTELAEALGFAMALLEASRELPDKWGAAREEVTWQEMGWREINGAAGHRAVCKAYPWMPWEPRVNTFHDPDIPPDIQARTRDPWNYPDPELGFHEGDPENHRYVHVVGRWYRFRIMGWAWGREVHHPRFRHRSGVYYYPDRMLRPPETLVPP